MHRLVHSSSSLRRFYFVLLLLVSVTSFVSCKKASNLSKEVAYVNNPQVVLRDRLATIYEKRGTVKLGDKVYVLDHNRRFSYVRTEKGEEGWIADRYLIDAATYQQFEKLVADNANTPVQSHATARATLNLHVTPGRDTEHLFQLKEGEKVEYLKRATAEKPGSGQARPQPKKTAAGSEPEEPPPPPLEDWALVRTSEKRVGWVLARMLDIDVPLEIAQYAEGQRIVSSAILSKVQDGGKSVPQYLVMLTEPKDGLAWDYNQIRVFTWNTKRHRYETAYRERNLLGVFPVKVGTEEFGNEGVQPVFVLRVKDSQGQEKERKYRMIGPIVRRVATPEELKAEAADRAAQKAANPGKLQKKKRK